MILRTRDCPFFADCVATLIFQLGHRDNLMTIH